MKPIQPVGWLNRDLEEIVTAIDDLNAAVATLQANEAVVNQAVVDLIAEVANLQAAAAANNPAAIETAVTNINAVGDQLKALGANDPGTQPAPTA